MPKTQRTLTVVQINLHNLLTILRRLEVNILFIQELYILRHRILGLSDPDYRLFVPNTSNKVSTCSLANSIVEFVNHSILHSTQR